MPSRGVSVLLIAFAALQSVLTSGMVRPLSRKHCTIERVLCGGPNPLSSSCAFACHILDIYR